MNFGEIARKWPQILTAMVAAFTLFAMPNLAQAQDAAAVDVAADDSVAVEDAVAPPFEYYGSDMIKGQPTFAEDDFFASMTFQEQFSPNGHDALWLHDAILIPLIVGICVFVLFLLLLVVFRYRKGANKVPSKTSHNTLIEVIWITIPALILVAVAFPSIKLLAAQYESPPEDALTIKANGYQWYWGYEYVDNGGFEVISNMMDEDEAIAQGLPQQLAADNRMVVPVGVPIRIQTFGKDVIHSFGVPSLWFKLDAVPGRVNELTMMVEEPGIYYGQCMELCGARHGYMPIAIEARPLAEFEAWVLSQGGTLGGDEETAEAEEDAAVIVDEVVGAEVEAEVEVEAEEAQAET